MYFRSCRDCEDSRRWGNKHSFISCELQRHPKRSLNELGLSFFLSYADLGGGQSSVGVKAPQSEQGPSSLPSCHTASLMVSRWLLHLCFRRRRKYMHLFKELSPEPHPVTSSCTSLAGTQSHDSPWSR